MKLPAFDESKSPRATAADLEFAAIQDIGEDLPSKAELEYYFGLPELKPLAAGRSTF